MVDSGGLENRYTREGIQGSNPCLSEFNFLTAQDIDSHSIIDYLFSANADFLTLVF